MRRVVALHRGDGPLQGLGETGGQEGGVRILQRPGEGEAGARVGNGTVEPSSVVEQGAVTVPADVGDDLLRFAQRLHVQHRVAAVDEALDGAAAGRGTGLQDDE